MNFLRKLIFHLGWTPEAISNPKLRLAFYKYLLDYIDKYGDKGDNPAYLCHALFPFYLEYLGISDEGQRFKGRCWKAQEEVKALQNSKHLMRHVKNNLTCTTTCFLHNKHRKAFIEDCIALLKKNHNL